MSCKGLLQILELVLQKEMTIMAIGIKEYIGYFDEGDKNNKAKGKKKKQAKNESKKSSTKKSK